MDKTTKTASEQDRDLPIKCSSESATDLRITRFFSVVFRADSRYETNRAICVVSISKRGEIETLLNTLEEENSNQVPCLSSSSFF